MIKNKYFIGQTVWYLGYREKPTQGTIAMIYQQGFVLAYELHGVAYNFREENIFLTKEEAESAST